MTGIRKKKRILLVDDEPGIVNVQKKILERLGYCVTGFTSSEKTMSAFCANPHGFDLVLSGLRMPGITGDRLAREMISIRPDIPVILCTSHGEKNLEDLPGISAVLFKPVSSSDLARSVEQALMKDGSLTIESSKT